MAQEEKNRKRAKSEQYEAKLCIINLFFQLIEIDRRKDK